MSLKEVLFYLVMCVWCWVFIYELDGANLTRKILGIKPQDFSENKFKKFIVGDRFFKLILWLVTIVMSLVIVLESI